MVGRKDAKNLELYQIFHDKKNRVTLTVITVTCRGGSATHACRRYGNIWYIQYTHYIVYSM